MFVSAAISKLESQPRVDHKNETFVQGLDTICQELFHVALGNSVNSGYNDTYAESRL